MARVTRRGTARRRPTLASPVPRRRATRCAVVVLLSLARAHVLTPHSHTQCQQVGHVRLRSGALSSHCWTFCSLARTALHRSRASARSTLSLRPSSPPSSAERPWLSCQAKAGSEGDVGLVGCRRILLERGGPSSSSHMSSLIPAARIVLHSLAVRSFESHFSRAKQHRRASQPSDPRGVGRRTGRAARDSAARARDQLELPPHATACSSRE